MGAPLPPDATRLPTSRLPAYFPFLTLQAVSDIVRTTLGPKSMLKMLLDPMGGIVLTNDGNAILREVSPSPLTLLID